MTPAADERDGYVPNVVYSCGALLHGDTLVLPYGSSDAAIRVALVDLTALLDRIRPRSLIDRAGRSPTPSQACSRSTLPTSWTCSPTL